MGFANEQSSEIQKKDGDIMFELWRVLGGEIKQHVTLNNLRIFLLAIMGTYCEPGIKKEEQNLSKLDLFGQFND